MIAKERPGLTIVELAVVCAIIGVLSTLLLPAFARARQHSRQAVCMANIKSICRAFNMYMLDHDGRFPPRESDPQVVEYFNARPGGGDDDMWNPNDPAASHWCNRARLSNPYLRRPVILDDYLLTRGVWRCPDARLEGGATFINGAEDWIGHLRRHEGEWGMRSDPHLCPSEGAWPSGWGGEVTDSITQRRLPVPLSDKGKRASPGMFLQSIGVTEAQASEPLHNVVGDPRWFVICADAGATTNDFCTGTLAYPDLCGLECAGPGYREADWENCPWSRDCGATGVLKMNPYLRERYARHFGGVDLGFLDGHARWMHSEEVIAEAPSQGDPNRGHLRGFEPRGPTRDADWSDRPGSVPPLY